MHENKIIVSAMATLTTARQWLTVASSSTPRWTAYRINALRSMSTTPKDNTTSSQGGKHVSRNHKKSGGEVSTRLTSSPKQYDIVDLAFASKDTDIMAPNDSEFKYDQIEETRLRNIVANHRKGLEGAFSWFKKDQNTKSPALQYLDSWRYEDDNLPVDEMKPDVVRWHEVQEMRARMCELNKRDPDRWGADILAEIYDVKPETARNLIRLGPPSTKEPWASQFWLDNVEFLDASPVKMIYDDVVEFPSHKEFLEKSSSDEDIEKIHEKQYAPPPRRSYLAPLKKEYSNNWKDPRLVINVNRFCASGRYRYVFVDLTDSSSENRCRAITVREPNGILRKATQFERKRLQHRYWNTRGTPKPLTLQRIINWRQGVSLPDRPLFTAKRKTLLDTLRR